MEQTPLTVGSPQEVIEKTLSFRNYAGDYQRQIFLIDHTGLELKTVLEQLDLLGEDVVPVLRSEFAALKPTHVPEAPIHTSLINRKERGEEPIPSGTRAQQAQRLRNSAVHSLVLPRVPQ